VNVYQNLCFACHDKTGHGDPQMRNSMPEIPDFTSPTWQKTRSDQDLIHSIMEGKGKFMLSMKDKLGTVDAKDMVALVRAFPKGQIIEPAPAKAPGPPAPEKAIRTADVPKLPPEDPFAKRQPPPAPSGELAARIRTGAAIFQQFCIVCHGPDGTGTLMRASMPAIPNFTDSAWQQQKENAELQASILNGKGTLMPANSGRVTADQTRDLVAYIRAFGPSTLTAVPVTDSQFDRSFRQLQQQWDELERELQKIKSQSK
jgi:mono/diheme cytochrome c family protein